MVESQWLTNQLTPSKVVLLAQLVAANLVRYVTQRMLVFTDVYGNPYVGIYRRLGNSVCPICRAEAVYEEIARSRL